MTDRDPWEEDEDEEVEFDEAEEDEDEVDAVAIMAAKSEETRTVFGNKATKHYAGHQVQKIEHQKRLRVFLQQLARTGIVEEAARLAGYKDSRPLYLAREKDKSFGELWALSERAAGDVFEKEAIRRAVEGVIEPVFYKGIEVGGIRKYSDRLLGMILKKFDKEGYTERSQINSQTTVKVGIAVLPGRISSEDWAIQAKVIHENQRPVEIEGVSDKIIDEPNKTRQTVLER